MPGTILIAEGHDVRSRVLREHLMAFLRYRPAEAASGEDLFSCPRADKNLPCHHA